MADHLNPLAWGLALLQALLFVLAAPVFAAWVKWVKCRLQNRRAPSLLQPWRDIRRLFAKRVLLAHTASPVFRIAPYIVCGTMIMAASVLPLVALTLPLAAMADAIVLVALIALGRFFLALAGLDIGTAFGGMGSSREMTVSALAEPAMLMVVFTLAMIASSTNLSTVVAHMLVEAQALRPSLLFALIALILVGIAETGRIPVDNPATHLELTMIHEAMVLEYTGRHLAMMELAAQLKLMIYAVLVANLFFPWGIAVENTPAAWGLAFALLTGKLTVLGAGLAVAETAVAKMRLFKVPTFLTAAFIIALVGMLSALILEGGA